MGGEELFTFDGGWIAFSLLCIGLSCVVLYLSRTFQKQM